MKIFLSLILLFTFSVYSQDSRTISIVKNHQNEFVIKSDGKTIYKYNKENCDSSTISNLDEIYLKSNKDSSLSTNVTVLNLPNEEGFDLLTLLITLIAVVGTFASGYFGYRWNNKSQLEQYNRQIRAENKRQYLQQLRAEGTKLIIGLFAYRKLGDTDVVPNDYQNSLWSFYLLLTDEHKHMQDILFKCMLNSQSDPQKKQLDIDDFIVGIKKIIKEEQNKLDQGEF